MDIPGFTLLLQDFCDYCPDFEVEVESFDYTCIGQKSPKMTHSIRCKNRKRCARIMENLKAKYQNE